MGGKNAPFITNCVSNSNKGRLAEKWAKTVNLSGFDCKWLPPVDGCTAFFLRFTGIFRCCLISDGDLVNS